MRYALLKEKCIMVGIRFHHMRFFRTDNLLPSGFPVTFTIIKKANEGGKKTSVYV